MGQQQHKFESYDKDDIPRKFDDFIEWLNEKASNFKGEERDTLLIDLYGNEGEDTFFSFDGYYTQTDEQIRERAVEQNENMARVQKATRDKELKELARLKEIYE